MRETKEWGMFTHAGNVAVNQIVNTTVNKLDTRDAAYDLIMEQLEILQSIGCFAEATDTDVRERVWAHLVNVFREPVFSTSRKK